MNGIIRWVLRGVCLCAVLFGFSLPSAAWNAQVPLTLDVAIKVGNVRSFSPRDKTYSIEGLLRITLPAETNEKLVAMGIEPSELLRFKNQIDPWNSLMEPDGGLVKVGKNARVDYLFISEFYSDQIDYRGYPLGELPLELTLVPVPLANGAIRAYPYDGSVLASSDSPLPLKIRVNRAESSVSRMSNMEGYQLSKWSFVSRPDRIEMQLFYSPIGWAAFVKWLLPLVITMTLMLLTPTLMVNFASERLAIPPVILLTLVFMQQAYRESLPSLPYLTLLDTLYAFSYMVTLAFFCEFIWRANQLQRRPEQLKAPLQRLEALMQWMSLGGYAGLVIWAKTIT
jgi:hypothetical protein